MNNFFLLKSVAILFMTKRFKLRFCEVINYFEIPLNIFKIL